MRCGVCQQEAFGKCRSCGVAVCAEHGGTVCFRCATAVVATLPGRSLPDTAIRAARPDQPSSSGQGYLQCETVARPTIHVEDSGPPACHICAGLARHICRNCQTLYCPDHAAGSDLCATCARSSMLGLIILGLIFCLFLGLVSLHWLLERL